MAQYIYTMNRVSKVVPPKRTILRDISLSFFPGAKIGVLGLNGSGKSTLLRIMAGIDTDIDGEARPQNGIRVGFLPQEPQLDPEQGRARARDGRRRRHVQRSSSASTRSATSSPSRCRDDEMNALLEEQAKLQDAIDAAGGWELERKLEIAADALRLPPWDAKIATLSGGEKRRVALCRLLLSAPDMLLLDEPTNHLDAESIAWLERYLEEYPSTVIAVTHDRYFLDNVAGWILELDRGHGIPWQGNYSSWLEQKEKRLALEEREREAPAQDAGARARMGAPESEGAPGEEQGPPAALRRAAVAGIPGAQRDQRDLHPAGRAPGRSGHRSEEPAQGLRRPAADRQPVLQPAAPAASSASSARTAPARPRCSACSPASRSRTAARSASARR